MTYDVYDVYKPLLKKTYDVYKPLLKKTYDVYKLLLKKTYDVCKLLLKKTYDVYKPPLKKTYDECKPLSKKTNIDNSIIMNTLVIYDHGIMASTSPKTSHGYNSINTTSDKIITNTPVSYDYNVIIHSLYSRINEKCRLSVFCVYRCCISPY